MTNEENNNNPNAMLLKNSFNWEDEENRHLMHVELPYEFFIVLHFVKLYRKHIPAS